MSWAFKSQITAYDQNTRYILLSSIQASIKWMVTKMYIISITINLTYVWLIQDSKLHITADIHFVFFIQLKKNIFDVRQNYLL